MHVDVHVRVCVHVYQSNALLVLLQLLQSSTARFSARGLCLALCLALPFRCRQEEVPLALGLA